MRSATNATGPVVQADHAAQVDHACHAARAHHGVDAMGVAHAPASEGVRIVSLVPSVTELLLDLGLGAQVVGRTGFCIHPREAVRGIPKVGGTKDIDVERVRTLAPSHVLVNLDENPRDAVAAIAAMGVEVVATHPVEVEDNRALYRLVGAVFGRQAEAAALEAALDEALAQAHAVREGRPVHSVLYAIWKDPWMTVAADTYIARMLAAVGLEAADAAGGPARAGGRTGAARYPSFTLANVDWRRIDALLLSSEPYRFGARHASELAADPRLARTAVERVDGEMASWYGSRAIAGLRWLARFRVGLDEAIERRRAGAR